MVDYRDQGRSKSLESLRGSLLMLAFGLSMLAYLITIDRPEWFNLRPASGTAAAMSNASNVEHARKDGGFGKRHDDVHPHLSREQSNTQ